MEIEKLEKEYAELQHQLTHIGFICSGSVMSLYRKCGKHNCGCNKNESMQHGPYHIWTRKEKGKTVTRSLSERQAGCCSEYIQNLRRMESIIERMKEISAQVLEQQR